jgi:HEAT repeat protein
VKSGDSIARAWSDQRVATRGGTRAPPSGSRGPGTRKRARKAVASSGPRRSVAKRVRDPLDRLRSARTPADRAAAAQALARLDSAEAVAALRDALSDPAAEVRTGAALALASLRDPASIPALARIVADWGDPSLIRCRRAALGTLVAFSSEQAAVELARALVDARAGGSLDLEARSALLAVVYAEPRGVAAPRVVRTLVALLGREDAAARDRAGALLELFPTEGVGPLARSLRTAAAPEIRRRAAEALRACRHDEAVSALVAALRDPAAEVRASAARSLGEMRDPVAVDALYAAAGDEEEAVREAARSALSALGAVATATGMAAGLGPPAQGRTGQA